MVALNPQTDFPLYSEVPKDFLGNLDYRARMVARGSYSREEAQTLFIACARDPLFFVNVFVWTYDPRKQESPALPFITYEFQDAVLLEILDAIGDHDLFTDKSRDMGATWLHLIAMYYRWRFFARQSFLLLSRKEDLVDETDDMDALMPKLDFIHEHLPTWLQPNIDRRHLHLQNVDNKSSFDGESTTGDAGRGGRRTAIFPDEFASILEGERVLRATRDATRCRLFCSTPKGAGNAFYELRQKPDDELKKLSLHWSKHPEKNEGLYTSADGKVQILDTEYWRRMGAQRQTEYPFILDGKLRSPWYDNECRRAANPKEIAQELDIDYGASDDTFFHLPLLEEIKKRDARQAFVRGELNYDMLEAKPLEFVQMDAGELLLWCNLDVSGAPPASKYAVGADPAVGTMDISGKGASNSCISIVDRQTGEKVGELATCTMEAREFAILTIALCRWFKDKDGNAAFLIWEANGPAGGLFTQAVLEMNYGNIFYRRNEEKRSGKVTEMPGWGSSRRTKVLLLGDYRAALGNTFTNRSEKAIDECRFYVRTIHGGVEHSRAMATDEPTEAREAHGDRVIADALANRALKELVRTEPEEPEVPASCFMARRRVRQREQGESEKVLVGW